jgi:hypothetical protein
VEFPTTSSDEEVLRRRQRVPLYTPRPGRAPGRQDLTWRTGFGRFDGDWHSGCADLGEVARGDGADGPVPCCSDKRRPRFTGEGTNVLAPRDSGSSPRARNEKGRDGPHGDDRKWAERGVLAHKAFSPFLCFFLHFKLTI